MLYLNSIQYSAFCFTAGGKMAVQALYTGSLLHGSIEYYTASVYNSDRGRVFGITTTIIQIMFITSCCEVSEQDNYMNHPWLERAISWKR